MRNEISFFLENIENEIHNINYLIDEAQKELQSIIAELQVSRAS